jgi:hypothetical protein
MSSRLAEIFEDENLITKIKNKLPYLFQLAELETSRAGKIGMEVGSLREKILIALLMYKFGEENVETDIPITEPEVDVKLFDKPISIKTITGLSGVKLIWTVDAEKAKIFRETYVPHSDMLLVQIKWNSNGAIYYIPLETQKKVLVELGREKYIKLPKPGTNPRGVEITKEGLLRLLRDENIKKIEIFWKIYEIKFDPYKRWIDYWRED